MSFAEFKYFPWLPKELRTMIWGYAVVDLLQGSGQAAFQDRTGRAHHFTLYNTEAYSETSNIPAEYRQGRLVHESETLDVCKNFPGTYRNYALASARSSPWEEGSWKSADDYLGTLGWTADWELRELALQFIESQGYKTTTMNPGGKQAFTKQNYCHMLRRRDCCWNKNCKHVTYHQYPSAKHPSPAYLPIRPCCDLIVFQPLDMGTIELSKAYRAMRAFEVSNIALEFDPSWTTHIFHPSAASHGVYDPGPRHFGHCLALFDLGRGQRLRPVEDNFWGPPIEGADPDDVPWPVGSGLQFIRDMMECYGRGEKYWFERTRCWFIDRRIRLKPGFIFSDGNQCLHNNCRSVFRDESWYYVEAGGHDLSSGGGIEGWFGLDAGRNWDLWYLIPRRPSLLACVAVEDVELLPRSEGENSGYSACSCHRLRVKGPPEKVEETTSAEE